MCRNYDNWIEKVRPSSMVFGIVGREDDSKFGFLYFIFSSFFKILSSEVKRSTGFRVCSDPFLPTSLEK